jgi:hypothetical protein
LKKWRCLACAVAPKRWKLLVMAVLQVMKRTWSKRFFRARMTTRKWRMLEGQADLMRIARWPLLRIVCPWLGKTRKKTYKKALRIPQPQKRDPKCFLTPTLRYWTIQGPLGGILLPPLLEYLVRALLLLLSLPKWSISPQTFIAVFCFLVPTTARNIELSVVWGDPCASARVIVRSSKSRATEVRRVSTRRFPQEATAEQSMESRPGFFFRLRRRRRIGRQKMNGYRQD